MDETGHPSDRRTLRLHSGARTCVGCRRRADRSVLLRVVAVQENGSAHLRLEPDPDRRLPGRGAWVHPVGECLEKAIARRAFGRALRLAAAPNPETVERWVQAAATHSGDEHDEPCSGDPRRS